MQPSQFGHLVRHCCSCCQHDHRCEHGWDRQEAQTGKRSRNNPKKQPIAAAKSTAPRPPSTAHFTPLHYSQPSRSGLRINRLICLPNSICCSANVFFNVVRSFCRGSQREAELLSPCHLEPKAASACWTSVSRMLRCVRALGPRCEGCATLR